MTPLSPTPQKSPTETWSSDSEFSSPLNRPNTVTRNQTNILSFRSPEFVARSEAGSRVYSLLSPEPSEEHFPLSPPLLDRSARVTTVYSFLSSMNQTTHTEQQRDPLSGIPPSFNPGHFVSDTNWNTIHHRTCSHFIRRLHFTNTSNDSDFKTVSFAATFDGSIVIRLSLRCKPSNRHQQKIFQEKLKAVGLIGEKKYLINTNLYGTDSLTAIKPNERRKLFDFLDSFQVFPEDLHPLVQSISYCESWIEPPTTGIN